MNLVDSSGWMEYFNNGPNASFFAHAIEDTAHLIVPTLCLFEIFKKFIQKSEENAGLKAVAFMRQGRVILLDSSLAVLSAKYSHNLKVPLADSIIYATAQFYNTLLWTLDADFKDLPGVKYCVRKNG